MAGHEPIEITEGAAVDSVIRAGSAPPVAADALDACDTAGPFRGARCTEPAGHVGDHQHHADGARASWGQAR